MEETWQTSSERAFQILTKTYLGEEEWMLARVKPDERRRVDVRHREPTSLLPA
ncbi:hypothetical protein K2173_019522 [Erythroxylum novogranatense]|uniref:Uncharacterized protein n=1 Tax=Erythroxylum novogranatense TaxID=1862640 RepID=A0AAV8UEA7_9ROSI|nr:hypothetical protein K2173_019522 [Erythroxylum novogranatense]